ncbi:FkbM family methyltransferase [Bradyrhizobium sp. CW9]|uniref:FkbM family methyltransferase n=1 Tax=Bradyrhizobium sp. CW9 TaxID=2782689 RepID=UPI001FF720D3|nr:FkbM family methyltransferase [Bradyrhizobium sp. CW9]MCK1328236.1 FkbM family methyltransferase [Bradyrhizobium sp. CW9]
MASNFSRRLRNAVVFGTIPATTHVTFIGRGKLFVDPLDNRGQSVLKSLGATQPIISLVWRGLVRRIRPDIVLDVGANYGEIALSTKYSATSKIHLFEPNPHVRAYLNRSVSTHVNRENIQVHSEVASDRIGSVEFIIDRKWSGTSSVVGEIEDTGFKGQGAESYERLNLPTTTLDQCFGSVSNERLLFKIDVEGFENQVIQGMDRILRQSASFGGIIEFDRRSLLRANTDPDVFVAELRKRGEVKVLSNGTLSDLKRPPDHCDLLLVSKESYLEGLLLIPKLAKSISPRAVLNRIVGSS